MAELVEFWGQSNEEWCLDLFEYEYECGVRIECDLHLCDSVHQD